MVKVPKQLGRFAGVIVWLGSVLSTPWVVVMGTLITTVTTAVTVGTAWLEKPSVHAVALTFLVLLWTWIGLVVLADRNRPKPVIVQKDLSYGIIVEAVAANYNSFDENDNMLSFSVSIRNFTPSALYYEFKKFEIFVSKRIIRTQVGFFHGLLQRGGAKTSTSTAFTKDDLKDLIGKELLGTMDLEIAYGLPGETFARIFKVNLKLHLNFKTEPFLAFANTIEAESDELYR